MTEINLKDYEEAGIDYASVSDNLSKVINNINGVIDKLHYKVKNIVTDDVSSIMTKLNIDKSNIDLTSENIALIYIIYLGAINSVEIDFGNLEDIFSNIDLLKLGEKMDPETYIQFLSMLGFSSSRIKELIEENNRILNEFNNNSTSVFIGSDSALQQIYLANLNALTINLDYDENSNYSVNGNYEGLKRFVNLTQDQIDIIKTWMDEENPDYNLFIEQQRGRGLGYFYDTFDGKDLTDKEKFELLLSNLENGVSSIENEIQKMRSLELQTVKLQNALYGLNRFEELASFEIEKNSEGFIEFCETNASNGNEEQLSVFLINKVKSFAPDEANQNYLIEQINKGNYSAVASLLGGYGIGGANYMYWPKDDQDLMQFDSFTAFLNEVQSLYSVDSKYLTEEQKNLYMYFVYNGEFDKARNYFIALKDAINSKKGYEETEDFKRRMEESGAPPLTAFGEGFDDGIESFFEGIVSILGSSNIKSQNDYAKLYKMQYLMELAEKEGGLENFLSNHGYKFGVTAGTITPTIFLAAATAGTSWATAAPTLAFGGQIFGTQLHYDHVKNGELDFGSYFYAGIYALTEVVTERVLGGLPGLSNSQSGIITRMLNEANQEFVQTYLGRGIDSIRYEEAFDLGATTTEAIESALYAMLIAGVAAGGDSFRNRTFNFNTTDANGNQVPLSLSYEDSIDYLTELLENNNYPSVVNTEAHNNSLGETEGSIDGIPVETKIYEKGVINTEGSVDGTIINETSQENENSVDPIAPEVADINRGEIRAEEATSEVNVTGETTKPTMEQPYRGPVKPDVPAPEVADINRGEIRAEEATSEVNVTGETTKPTMEQPYRGPVKPDVPAPEVADINRGEIRAEEATSEVNVTGETTKPTMEQPYRGPVKPDVPAPEVADINRGEIRAEEATSEVNVTGETTKPTMEQPYRGPVKPDVPAPEVADINRGEIRAEEATSEVNVTGETTKPTMEQPYRGPVEVTKEVTGEHTVEVPVKPDVPAPEVADINRGEIRAEEATSEVNVTGETTKPTMEQPYRGPVKPDVPAPEVADINRGEIRAEEATSEVNVTGETTKPTMEQPYRGPVDVIIPSKPSPDGVVINTPTQNTDVIIPNTDEVGMTQPYRGPVDVIIPSKPSPDGVVINTPTQNTDVIIPNTDGVGMTQPYRGPVDVIIPPEPPSDGVVIPVPPGIIPDDNILIPGRDPFLSDFVPIVPPPFVDLPDDIDLPDFPGGNPDPDIPVIKPEKEIVVPPPIKKKKYNLIDEAILCTIVVRGIDNAMNALDNLFENGSYDGFSVRRPTEGFDINYIRILASFTPDEIFNYLYKRVKFYYGVDYSKEDVEFIIFKYIIMLINERTAYSGNILGIDSSSEIKSASNSVVSHTINNYPQVGENGELNYYLKGPIIGNILSNVKSIEEVNFSGNKFEIGQSLNFSGLAREKFSAFTRELTANVDYTRLNDNTKLPNHEEIGNIKNSKLLFPKISNDYSLNYNESTSTSTKVVRITLDTGEQVYIEDPRDLLCREYNEYINNMGTENDILRDEKDVFSLYNGLSELYGSEELDNYVKSSLSSDIQVGKRDIIEFRSTLK